MTTRVRRAAAFLLAGLMSVDAATTAALLVHGVIGKRIVAAVTGVVVAAASGVIIAIRTSTPDRAVRQTATTDARPEREVQ